MSTEKKTQHKDIRDAKAFKAVGQGVEKVGKIKFISEFKDFISKGNVMDMAVGMIVGAAFTAIVTSLVNNILMPALGMITGKIDFSDLKIVLKAAVKEGTRLSSLRSLSATAHLSIPLSAFYSSHCRYSY